jgi:alpha-beta hydrolase superfamily lysophospholipase
MAVLKIVLKILVVLFVAIQVGIYFFQEKLIFYPEKLPAEFVFKSEMPFSEMSIPSGDAMLSVLRYRVKDPKGMIVYYHGNAGSLRTWTEVGDRLARLGYDVLIFDYRGFGKSVGRYQSEDDLLEDGRTILGLARKEYPDSKIVIFGRSLGTGIATRMASEFRPKLLILESPFLSALSRGQQSFPFVLPFLMKYPLRSDLYASKVTCPVFIAHGTEDEIIPYASGEALTHKFNPAPSFLTVKGGHHNDLWDYPDYRAFIEKALL